MNFPETIPRDDMDLFLNECRLAGAQYFADKRRRRVLLRFEESWVLYMRYNDSYRVKEALPDRLTTEMKRKVCKLWEGVAGAVISENPAAWPPGISTAVVTVGPDIIVEYALVDSGYWEIRYRAD